jgi:hypothetical protein
MRARRARRGGENAAVAHHDRADARVARATGLRSPRQIDREAHRILVFDNARLDGRHRSMV